MSIEPKVSCICITHNRLGMFERALQCFLSQTYQNKELVVLFENDPVTEEYIRRNKRYSYFELHQVTEITPSYFLETINGESSPLNEGLNVLIKNSAGLTFVSPNDGNYQFLDRDTKEYCVSIEEFSDNQFLLKCGDHWLNFNSDGTCELTTVRERAYRYGHTHHLDCTMSLDIAPSMFQHNSTEHVGWEKKAIHNGEIKNVVFYNIFPKHKMSLGMKRNLSIRAALGDYICVWDDDDWYSKDRIYNQMSFLHFTQKRACSLAYTILFDQNTEQAYYNSERATGHENSLLFRKEGTGFYGNLNAQEDTPLLIDFYSRNQLSIMDDPELYIYNYHRKNTSSSNHFKKVIMDSTPLDADCAKRIKDILTLAI